MRELTKEQKRDIRAITASEDEDIDSSDAPVVLDWSGDRAHHSKSSQDSPAAQFGRHAVLRNHGLMTPSQSSHHMT